MKDIRSKEIKIICYQEQIKLIKKMQRYKRILYAAKEDITVLEVLYEVEDNLRSELNLLKKEL